MNFGRDAERIQNKLIDLGTAGPFYAISYTAAGKLVVTNPLVTVTPAEVLAEDLSSVYGLPERNRRSYRLDRQEWLWELRLGFNGAVYTERFEQNWAANPLLLPADKTNSLRGVSLELKSVGYVHPPKHGPKTTKVTYTLNARLWPL
jgi:hypothetical protein